jgi:hypothetical protein
MPSEFEHKLNAMRELGVSECFHEIVAAHNAAIAEPVYDQSVVKRIATQMGWTPPGASPVALTMDNGAILDVVDQCFGSGYYSVDNADWIKFARALLAAQPAEPAHPDRQRIEAEEDDKRCEEGEREMGLGTDRQGVALSDEEIDAIWCNLDARGATMYEPHTWQREMRLRFARAILSRASSSRAEVEIPDGYALVPKVPTHDIRKAMHHAYWQTPHLPYHDGSPELWNATYAALLTAAAETGASPSWAEVEIADVDASAMNAWVELWDAAVEAHNATYAETRFQKRSQFKEVADRAEAAGNRLRAAMEATREARLIAYLAAAEAPKGEKRDE